MGKKHTRNMLVKVTGEEISNEKLVVLDFKQLRKQKLLLDEIVRELPEDSEALLLDGIVGLVDMFQDSCAKVFGESVVFGKKHADVDG